MSPFSLFYFSLIWRHHYFSTRKVCRSFSFFLAHFIRDETKRFVSCCAVFRVARRFFSLTFSLSSWVFDNDRSIVTFRAVGESLLERLQGGTSRRLRRGVASGPPFFSFFLFPPLSLYHFVFVAKEYRRPGKRTCPYIRPQL